jgi:hypothetical protein
MQERSKELIEQAAKMAGMSPEEYKEVAQTQEISEDGEMSEEGIPMAPAEYKPHAWFVDEPAGYA